MGFASLTSVPALRDDDESKVPGTSSLTFEEQLASYVPAHPIFEMLAAPEVRSPTKPERQDFEGAVAFVDISGFTKLSETLKKQHGKGGSEKLNVYINAYFEQLMNEVTKFHGDVIKFAGDALQVVWRAPAADGRFRKSSVDDPCRKGLAGYVLRASQCCLHLLQRLDNFSPVEGVSLKLHMGVGAGTIQSFVVGGFADKWEYFIAGEPIQQMRCDHARRAVQTAARLAAHA